MTEEAEWAGLPYKPNPDCKVCKGAGVLHPKDGETILFNRIVYCTAKGCLFDSVKRAQPKSTQIQCFENFQSVAGTHEALKFARQLAYAEKDFIWLLIYGGTGNGKTHLCNAIVKVVRERGAEVRMILAADLFSRLREAIETKQADALLRSYKDIFFLAIDDYGVEFGSDWESAKFDELMTSRYMTGKPTVLITNKTLSEIPDRILSRFKDAKLARVAHNSAPDYRGKK